MLLVTCNEVYIRLKQLGESDKIAKFAKIVALQ